LVTTSAGFIDMMLAVLRTDVDLPWPDFEQRSRDYGRLRAAQGLPLELLIDVLAVYRRATIELLSRPIQGKPHYDEIIAIAQGRPPCEGFGVGRWQGGVAGGPHLRPGVERAAGATSGAGQDRWNADRGDHGRSGVRRIRPAFHGGRRRPGGNRDRPRAPVRQR